MSLPPDPNLEARLRAVAERAIEATSVTLGPPDRAALDELVSHAATVLASSDESEIRRAEQAFTRLADAVASDVTDDDILPERLAGPSLPLSHGRIRAALRRLCPGFWPFC